MNVAFDTNAKVISVWEDNEGEVNLTISPRKGHSSYKTFCN